MIYIALLKSGKPSYDSDLSTINKLKQQQEMGFAPFRKTFLEEIAALSNKGHLCKVIRDSTTNGIIVVDVDDTAMTTLNQSKTIFDFYPETVLSH